MNAIGDLGDPKKDAEALGPVLSQDLKDFAAALVDGLRTLRDEGSITVTTTIKFEKKG